MRPRAGRGIVVAVQQGDAGDGEGLLHSVQQRGQRLFAAQQAAGEGGEGFGLGVGAGGLTGASGGGVDDAGDQCRDHDEDDQREEILGLGDGERVDGRDEVVVEQQAGHERGDDARGRKPPTRLTMITTSRNNSRSLPRLIW